MLDAPLTTGAVTDIAGRVGGAVGAGRSSHASVSITTVRESRTVRLTTHLRAMGGRRAATGGAMRSEEHTSELQSQSKLVCRLLLEKKKKNKKEKRRALSKSNRKFSSGDRRA